MLNRILLIIISILLLLTLCSCASILEGDKLSVTPHAESGDVSPNDDAIEVTSYDSLRSKLFLMIMEHKESATFTINIFEFNDVEASVEQVCMDVAFDDPFGAYCVYYINSAVSQMVSHYEAKITINYRHTKAQIDGIITAYSQRYIRSELLDALSSHSKYIVFLTNLSVITEDYIIKAVSELYRNNPLALVSLPLVSVTVYSSDSEIDRIIEISFEYPYALSLLNTMTENSNAAVQEIVDTIGEDSDAYMLLSLCRALIDHVQFDVEAEANPLVTEQHLLNTAYSALVNGVSASEGYALAYKALCDKLGLECYVVSGRLNGFFHVWNIVGIDGEYYHVDVAMCDANGIETAFLKRDTDIINEFWWDTENYEACSGSLTYHSLVDTPQPPDTHPESQPDEPQPDDPGPDDPQQEEETNETT